MEKRISFFEFQTVKSVAKGIEPLIREQEKIKSQIEKLAEEYKKKQEGIDALDAGVVNVLGYHVFDLVEKQETEYEINGKTVKKSKYVPTARVKYDDTAKQYVISNDTFQEETTESDVEETEVSEDGQTVGDTLELPMTEVGNDFDEDKEEEELPFEGEDKKEEEIF